MAFPIQLPVLYYPCLELWAPAEVNHVSWICLRGCVATIISSTLQPIGHETSTTEYNNILLYSAYKYSDIYKMESSL